MNGIIMNPNSTDGSEPIHLGSISTSTFIVPRPWKFCPDCAQKLEPAWNFCCACGNHIPHGPQYSIVTGGSQTIWVSPQTS